MKNKLIFAGVVIILVLFIYGCQKKVNLVYGGKVGEETRYKLATVGDITTEIAGRVSSGKVRTELVLKEAVLSKKKGGEIKKKD